MEKLPAKEDALVPSLTFPLPQYTEGRGTSEAEVHWVALRREGKVSAEGKLFLPPERRSPSSLVIFEPGMPGGGMCEFVEKAHVPALLKEGYCVFVLRHLGAWLHTNLASEFVACPERVARGKELGQHTLGEQHPYNIEQMAKEVSTAVNALGESFEHISIIGHSSGALGAIRAFTEIEEETRKKVRHLISLAGLTGDIRNIRFPLRTSICLRAYFRRCQRALHMVEPKMNVEELRIMFRGIYEQELEPLIPEHVMVIQINSPKDEYILPNAAKAFQERLGRGLNIVDNTQPNKKYHHLRNLQPETLLRLLKMYHPEANHTVVFDKKHTKNGKK